MSAAGGMHGIAAKTCFAGLVIARPARSPCQRSNHKPIAACYAAQYQPVYQQFTYRSSASGCRDNSLQRVALGDSVPVLVRNRLTQELRTDGRFISVSSDEDNLQADFELGGDLSSFQGVYNGNKGEVLIQFDTHLVQTSNRRVIASQRFVIRQPISGSSMNEVVEAFGLASDRLAADILRWLVNTSAMRSP